MTVNEKKQTDVVSNDQLERASVSDLIENPDNKIRKITDERLEMLDSSMKEFGDLSGIIVNTVTGHMIGGHQRVKSFDPSWAIKKGPFLDDVGTTAVGYVDTPFGRWTYREVDWHPDKEKAALIAANKHGGQFVEKELNTVLLELDEHNFPVGLTGFSEEEIAERIQIQDERPAKECEFATELMESNNYLVIMATNDIDWSQIKTLFGLGTVKALDSKPGFEKRGVARVKTWSDAFKSIRENYADIDKHSNIQAIGQLDQSEPVS